MKIYRTLAMAGILVIALLLAFPLRDAVYDAVIVPLAYAFWLLSLIYHSVNQALLWFVVVFIVFLILLRSLLPEFKVRAGIPTSTKPPIGQVEGLAIWVRKAERGTYFKWLIANRLGKIAHSILLQRDSGKRKSVFDPLKGTDWEPHESVQTYLETGLHGSFTDYPYPTWPFARRPQTPLDLNTEQAVEFLESQLGNE